MDVEITIKVPLGSGAIATHTTTNSADHNGHDSPQQSVALPPLPSVEDPVEATIGQPPAVVDDDQPPSVEELGLDEAATVGEVPPPSLEQLQSWEAAATTDASMPPDVGGLLHFGDDDSQHLAPPSLAELEAMAEPGKKRKKKAG